MNQLYAIIFGLLIIFSSSNLQAQAENKNGDFPQIDLEALPPECGTMKHVSEGFGEAFLAVYKAIAAIGTTIVPHLGYRVEDEAGAILITWPLQWAFGTVVGENTYSKSKCRRKGRRPEQFKAHRLVLEPQINAYTHHPDVTKTYFGFRPAYRFVYHSENSKLGYGIGIGGQFLLEGSAGIKSSLSGELLLQYGKCCVPGFLDVAARYDYTFSDETHSVSVLFGISYY